MAKKIMGELIATSSGEICARETLLGYWWYEKYDADKIIAWNKYKRCLAMASRCVSKSNYHFVLARHGEYCKENNKKSILYAKWHKRWLEIAQNFLTRR